MSDEEVRRMIEEATKESLRQSFTEAGRKYLKAAEASEQKGDFEGAEKLYKQAAEAYEKAADKYRSAKSFKNAALNMCGAGDVYSELADAEKAVKAYVVAAEDLMAASGEHLMWGEDAETKKGTIIAVIASMMYLMVGKEAEAFYKARTFAAENASKLRFPGVVRLSQIPQMLESAIHAVDIEAFAAAENAVVTELKAALPGAAALEFSKYVDKGLDMVREILRGKLKVPKVVTQLVLPVDMTFSEQFPIKAIIHNSGDGYALKLNLEWHIDEDLAVVSGDKQKSIPSLEAGKSIEVELEIKAAQELTGVREYSILIKGGYSDQLNTEYSLQAGPATLVLKDFKESEKLLQGVDVTDGRIGLLGSSLDQSSLEKEPFSRLISTLTDLVMQARTDIDCGQLESAKARMYTVNEIIDLVDSILGDDELLNRIQKDREAEKKSYALSVIQPLRDSVVSSLTHHEEKMQKEVMPALDEWDSMAQKKRELSETAGSLRIRLSELARELDSIYNKMPSASATQNPEEASMRTHLRKALDGVKTTVTNLGSDAESLASSSFLQPGERPDTPGKVEMVLVTLKSIRNELTQMLDSTKDKLA